MAENKQYKEGDVYRIYNKRGNKLLQTITIPESMCKAGLDRMLFFKYNIPPGDYSAQKVGSSE
jgi:hypothetical protein|nr:MAG TPA: hypothetical protein [Caudoviricetes sp.]